MSDHRNDADRWGLVTPRVPMDRPAGKPEGWDEKQGKPRLTPTPPSKPPQDGK